MHALEIKSEQSKLHTSSRQSPLKIWPSIDVMTRYQVANTYSMIKVLGSSLLLLVIASEVFSNGLEMASARPIHECPLIVPVGGFS